mmetsp:Transcript_41132/g.66248  ORF Transcript_41132/g.66248 Transcript_41132/m.66248 type:complete len:241 (-) Transcript_41132:2014-2736(-)
MSSPSKGIRPPTPFGHLGSLKVDFPHEFLGDTVHGTLQRTTGLKQITGQWHYLELIPLDTKHLKQIHGRDDVAPQKAHFLRNQLWIFQCGFHCSFHFCLFVKTKCVKPQRAIPRNLLEPFFYDCNSPFKFFIFLLKLCCLKINRSIPWDMLHQIFENLSSHDNIPGSSFQKCPLKNRSPCFVNALISQTSKEGTSSLKIPHPFLVLDRLCQQLLSIVAIFESLMQYHPTLMQPTTLLFHF